MGKNYRSFDRLAKRYQQLEHFVFGDALERARAAFVDTIPEDASRALLIGDGDGRFAETLLQRYPDLWIDSVDSSEGMLQVASERVRSLSDDCSERYNAILADAREYEFLDGAYDLAVVQFALDCFGSEEANGIVRELSRGLRPGGALLYADFAVPEAYPWKPLGWMFIRILYAAFRMAAGLRTQRLPVIDWPEEFEFLGRETWLKGMLVSEAWKKD